MPSRGGKNGHLSSGEARGVCAHNLRRICFERKGTSRKQEKGFLEITQLWRSKRWEPSSETDPGGKGTIRDGPALHSTMGSALQPWPGDLAGLRLTWQWPLSDSSKRAQGPTERDQSVPPDSHSGSRTTYRLGTPHPQGGRDPGQSGQGTAIGAPCRNEVIAQGQLLLDLRLPGEESLPFVHSSSGLPQCPRRAQLSRERLSGRDALIPPAQLPEHSGGDGRLLSLQETP